MDLDRLRAQLLASGIQQTNNALFQVVEQLIRELRNTNNATGASSGGISSSLSALTLLTSTNQATSLPNSRQLIAGDNINFDDSVANERTISVANVQWSVLTDGDLIEPELIFAGGDVIMLHIP